MGGDWRAWNGGEIRTTYFYNEIDDLIYLGPRKPGPGGKDVRQRINAGKARTDGITFSVTHRFDADNRIFANFTYTHSEMLENSASPSSVGKRLTGLPEKQANIGFETRYGNWLLSSSGRYASKQYSDDANADAAIGVYKAYDAYFVVDSKLSYRFNKELTASLAVSNLLDREYFSYYAPWQGLVRFCRLQLLALSYLTVIQAFRRVKCGRYRCCVRILQAQLNGKAVRLQTDHSAAAPATVSKCGVSQGHWVTTWEGDTSNLASPDTGLEPPWKRRRRGYRLPRSLARRYSSTYPVAGRLPGKEEHESTLQTPGGPARSGDLGCHCSAPVHNWMLSLLRRHGLPRTPRHSLAISASFPEKTFAVRQHAPFRTY